MNVIRVALTFALSATAVFLVAVFHAAAAEVGRKPRFRTATPSLVTSATARDDRAA
jgi:hypothetical protein